MDPDLTEQPGNRYVQNAMVRDKRGKPTDSCVFRALAGYAAVLEKLEVVVRHVVDLEACLFRKR
jgi:hypothetical protein